MRDISNIVDMIRHSGMGANDDSVTWLDDNGVVWLLSWDIYSNYAGLSKLVDGGVTWESVIFVQTLTDKHADALDFCEVAEKDKHHYADGDDVNLAMLCHDYPYRMRNYFLLWDCD